MKSSSTKSGSRRLTGEVGLSFDERRALYDKYGDEAAHAYIAIELTTRRLAALGQPKTEDEKEACEFVESYLHLMREQLQKRESGGEPNYLWIRDMLNGDVRATMDRLAFMIDIQPRLDYADQMSSGRKPGARGRLRKAMWQVMKAWVKKKNAPKLTAEKLWLELAKNPPKNFGFYPDREKFIEGPGEDTNFASFSNAYTKEKQYQAKRAKAGEKS